MQKASVDQMAGSQSVNTIVNSMTHHSSIAFSAQYKYDI